MNPELNIATTNHVILEDNSQYFYTIKPFELTNALGSIVAILQEFVFMKGDENDGQICYKLYKTKEGNWYDIQDMKSSVEYGLLRRLKIALDMQETAPKLIDL